MPVPEATTVNVAMLPSQAALGLGWLEMAKHSGDVAMSSDPDEGLDEYPLELNGPFQ